MGFLDGWYKACLFRHCERLGEDDDNGYTTPFVRTCIPQVDPFPEERAKLQDKWKGLVEIETRQGFLEKIASGKLPLFLHAVPREEAYTNRERDRRDYGARVERVVKLFLGKDAEKYLKSPSLRFKSINDLIQIYQQTLTACGFPRPEVLASWPEDTTFAQQRVVGPGCAALRLACSGSQIPSALFGALRGPCAAPFVAPYPTLEEALEARRVFVVDHLTALDGLQARKGAILGGAVGLFFACPRRNILVPIAVQIRVKQEDEGYWEPVVTPHDSPSAWQCAKLIFNSADLHVQLATYIAHSVTAGALMWAAVLRCLSPHHPLRQLLHPFAHHAVAHAETVWRTLCCDESPLALSLGCTISAFRTLVAQTLHSFNFSDCVFTMQVDSRLPNTTPVLDSRYRDDGGLLWKAYHQYVGRVLQKYYEADGAFRNDSELCALLKTLHLLFNKVPDAALHTRSSVCNTITAILFTLTGYGAAFRVAMFDWFGFPTYSPAFVSCPFAGKPIDDITDNDVLDMLPPVQATLVQIALMLVLSGKSSPIPEGELLTQCEALKQRAPDAAHAAKTVLDCTARSPFCDKLIVWACQELRKDLQDMAAVLHARDALGAPYGAMDPSRISPLGEVQI